MKIRFVNHAGFILECAGKTLFCDPWTFGRAFNRGWSLISPSSPIDYSKVDYLWVSHQHPDHFNFPTLKSIPNEERPRITVLYQRHASPQIVDVFKKMGFSNVRELPLYRWIQLQTGIDLFCGSVGSMDSFLAVRSEGETILNLNDCILNHAHLRHIRKQVGRPSVLFTQFSFANWIGNYSDETHAADHKIAEFTFQVHLFQPEFTVTFASFVYFCNQENSWMNQFMVTPERVMALNLPGVNFMYPGDEWDSRDRQFRTTEAVEKYMRDLQHIVIDPTPPSIDPDRIQHTAQKSVQLLHDRFGKFLVSRIENFDIYLHDVDKVLSVNAAASFCSIRDATPETKVSARYVMCSQAAWYSFQFPWGWGALQVSGMYLDREHITGRNKFAFYQNMLGTGFLDFHDARSSLRTITFLWSKRFELISRFANRVSRGSGIPPATGQGTEAHASPDIEKQ